MRAEGHFVLHVAVGYRYRFGMAEVMRAAMRVSSTPQRELNDTASAILDSLGDLLMERPIRDVSVADILTESGFARGTFYLWFDNKFDAVGRAYLRETEGVGKAGAELFASGDADLAEATERVEKVIDELLSAWGQQGHILRAVHDTWRSEPSVAKHWAPAFRWVQDSAAQLIAEVRGRTEVNNLDRVLASSLINMNDYTLYQASLGEGFALDDDVREVLTRAWVFAVFGSDTHRPSRR